MSGKVGKGGRNRKTTRPTGHDHLTYTQAPVVGEKKYFKLLPFHSANNYSSFMLLFLLLLTFYEFATKTCLQVSNETRNMICRFLLSASNAMFCNLIFKLNFYFEMYSLYRVKFKFVKMLPFSGQPIRVTVGVRGKYPFLFMM